MEEMHTGTLSDTQILELCKDKTLIEKEFVEENINQCCYELRAGNIYYDLSKLGVHNRCEIENEGYILIKPKQNIVIITKEYLNIPHDMLGRILTKGKLFSVGLLPVNTYADPGFTGNIGIVLHNSSNNYLKIKPGAPIGKIEFSKLSKPVSKPYRGQHGFESGMWPVPTDMILTEEEVQSDSRIGNKHQEIENSYGKNITNLVKGISFIKHSLIFTTFMYFALLIFYTKVNNGTDNSEMAFAVTAGIIANILFGLLTYATRKFWPQP